MALAVVLVLLVVGSLVFHWLSPWYLTEIASNWGMIDDTINITFWVCGIVFVAVNLFLAYAVYRYRYSADRRADYEPENKKLEIQLTIVTAIGVIAMLAPGLFVWAQFVNVPDDAAQVEAVGQQWHWSFRFPGEDGLLGTIDARLVSPQNPFGMNPEDPNGQDDVLVASNEVHLPLDQPVKVLLRSKDVLHNFAVPQFRVKMDLVPGMVTYVWFTPIRTGSFEIMCEELCGLAHHTMRGRVVVDEVADFQAWLAAQPTYAETQAVTANAEAGKASFAVCAACHAAQGEGNPALHAPKLAGQEEWYLIRQLNYYKQGVRGAHEDDTYGRQMAPMASTLVDDAAIRNVAAYIQTLPDKPAPTTLAGDVKKGKRLYRNCAACHGAHGEGIWSMNAPRLAGMSDWYLAQQLQHFKQGVRGAHRQDRYGLQMRLMAEIATDDQAVNDVVTYINSL